MNILLLSRYGRQGASSRYRSYQYLPYIRGQNMTVTVAPLLDDEYLHTVYAGKHRAHIRRVLLYIRRVAQCMRRGRYDLIWLEKEVLPWLPYWLERWLCLSGVPYIVDYDDAVFHRYDQHWLRSVRWLLGTKIDRVMQQAALVIVGNDYLAQRARAARARRVEIIPTVVDLERYPLAAPPDNHVFTIGWIGSPSTSRHLAVVQPALAEVCQDRAVQVVAIGASTSLAMPGVSLIIKQWHEATEVHELQQFDVGIMPLPDSDWERGKSGFKLIQYMACARPVVGSPVGVNKQLILDGVNGFQCGSMAEWVAALRQLQHDRELCQRLGRAGRNLVAEQYSLPMAASRLVPLLQQAGKCSQGQSSCS